MGSLPFLEMKKGITDWMLNPKVNVSSFSTRRKRWKRKNLCRSTIFTTNRSPSTPLRQSTWGRNQLSSSTIWNWRRWESDQGDNLWNVLIIPLKKVGRVVIKSTQELFDREEVSARTASEAQIRHRFFNQKPQVLILVWKWFLSMWFLRESFGLVGPSGQPREGSAWRL